MVRRLDIDELAAESGASAAFITRLTEIGVLRRDAGGTYGAGDLIRLEAVNAFLEAGVDLPRLEAALAAGMFTFDYLHRFHPEPQPASRRTFQEFAEARGVSLLLLNSIYLAMGLPEPAADKPLREDEEALLEAFLSAWSAGGDEDTYLRAARLIGEPARQVSEGWTRLYVEKVSDRLPQDAMTPEERVTTILESTERLTRLAPSLLLWLFHRHLRHAIDRANIDGLEQQLVAQGLSLPAPDRPPLIAFVDISGYTGFTDAHGDERAAAVADRLRQLAERSARAHAGTVVKLLGDGAMLYFDTAPDGLAAVLALLRELSVDGLEAHAGMHAGPVIEHDGDYFGRTVNLAARVSSVAAAGEVVVTDAVVSAVDDDVYAFERRPPVTLKGIAEPIALFLATRRASAS